MGPQSAGGVIGATEGLHSLDMRKVLLWTWRTTEQDFVRRSSRYSFYQWQSRFSASLGRVNNRFLAFLSRYPAIHCAEGPSDHHFVV